jgi:hypothetical protein
LHTDFLIAVSMAVMSRWLTIFTMNIPVF